MKENKFKKWLYWFSLAFVVIIVYKFLDNFSAIGLFLSRFIKLLMPFIMGALIAYILYIPCKKIEECFKKTKYKLLKKRARGLSIVTLYLIIGMVLFILVNVILPPIIISVRDLTNNLPEYYSKTTTAINNLPEDSILLKINSQEILNKLSSIDLEKYISLESILGYIKGVISFASVIFDIFVTIIISIYTLAQRESILNFMKKLTYGLFKEEKYKSISKYFRRTNEIFFNFVSGQVIDSIIVGIIVTIAMTIMKVKYAALLGFLIGLFNLIPFFGAIVAVIISIFITICTGGLSKAIWLTVVVVILQQIDANIINPKIIGNKLKMSPILVIFSVTIIGAYFGVLGMFLAVPIVAMLKIFVNDYLDYRIETRKQ